jgi:hypothetical protein
MRWLYRALSNPLDCKFKFLEIGFFGRISHFNLIAFSARRRDESNESLLSYPIATFAAGHGRCWPLLLLLIVSAGSGGRDSHLEI